MLEVAWETFAAGLEGREARPAQHYPATDGRRITSRRLVGPAIVRCVAPSEDPLANEPFSWLARADGGIVIRYHDAPVMLLRGKTAEKFATRMSGAEGPAAQQLMARATGNFKRGNERRGS